MVPKFRSKAAAQEFAKYVDLCRNLAIRSNRECKITLLGWDSSPTSVATTNYVLLHLIGQCVNEQFDVGLIGNRHVRGK